MKGMYDASDEAPRRQLRKVPVDEMQEAKRQIKTIQDSGMGLTSWEDEFIESVSDQASRFGKLSRKQIEIIERIYTERT